MGVRARAHPGIAALVLTEDCSSLVFPLKFGLYFLSGDLWSELGLWEGGKMKSGSSGKLGNRSQRGMMLQEEVG